jgi:hypothetical protein
VSSSEDSSLTDPASGFNNFNAPGADRLKFSPTLAQRGLSGTGDVSSRGISGSTNDYIELVRMDTGLVSRKVKYAEYGDLLRTLARRTFDESGNYTVSPFTLVVEDHETAFGVADTSRLGLILGPGKAYVSGYEFETIADTKISLDKARTTESFNNVLLTTQEGMFVDVASSDITFPRSENPSGSPTSGFDSNGNNSSDLTSISENRLLILFATIQGLETAIGTVRLRQIRPGVNGQIRFSLFDMQMFTDDNGDIFDIFDNTTVTASANVISDSQANNVQQFVSDGTIVPASVFDGFKFTFSTSNLTNLSSGRMVFRIPESGAVADNNGTNFQSNFTVTKQFNGKTTADNKIVITISAGDIDFIDGTNAVILVRSTENSNANTNLQRVTDFTFSADNTNGVLTIDLDNNNFNEQPFIVTIPMNFKSDTTNQNIRSKTLEDVTVTVQRNTSSTDPNLFIFDGLEGNAVVTDLYSVTSILDGGVDVTSKFTVDDGQRVDMYDFARLILNQNETLTNDFVTVNLKKFTHTYNNGGPFTRQSYQGNANFDEYEQSPKFNDPDTGTTFRLYDAIDFRPVRQSINDFATVGNPNVTPFTSAADEARISYSSFVPRIDSLVLGEDRILRLIKGTPSFTPLAPNVNETDLELYRVSVGAYTLNENDVGVRYIDSQRFTMSDIGDVEDATFTDSEFIYKSNIETQAIASALGLFPGSEALDTGVFVDDLIGHGNADVTRKQYNVSIDPVTQTVHPPFKTSNKSGTIASSSNASVFDTKYGKIATAATSGVSDYIENTASVATGITLNVNPFGVADYLGTIKIDPTFDRYWSETKAPKVVVNIAGENNAWQKAISAPTNVDGKRLGFGTQWKDWETIWFGRKLGSEGGLPLNDPDVKQYRRGQRASYVKRILSEKVTRQIGDRIVDLSIIPYMQSVTIDGFVEDVKPSATHYLYFDGSLVGDTGGYQAGASGAFEFSVTIPADTYLTGERVVRVSDGLTSGDISTATSSADAIFYALGNYKTIDAGSNSVRPPIKRRDGVNTDTFLGSDYIDSLGGIGVNVFNSLDPLAQTFVVDASNFPDGICLKSVSIFFAENAGSETNSTVNIQLRPVDDNGAPRRNYVIPFSEKRLRSQDIVAGAFNEFEFDAPVYLTPGTYAICVLSNDSSFRVNTTSSNDQSTLLPRLFVPRNDGQRTVYSDTQLKCKVTRFAFSEVPAEVAFTPATAFDSTVEPSALYFANARNVISRNPLTATFIDAITEGSNVAFVPNETFIYNNSESRRPTSVNIGLTATGKVSPYVDESQCKLLAIESFVDNAIDREAEKNANDERGSATAKYYSKIVSLDKPASNIAVRIAGQFPNSNSARVRVFGKFRGASSQTNSLNEEPYKELILSNFDTENTSGIFRLSSTDPNTGESDIVVNTFTGNSDAEGSDQDTGTFTEYQLKITLENLNTGNQNRFDSPIITSISAVPLGKITRNAFFDVVVPSGAVFPFAGDQVPQGFLFCNGITIDDSAGSNTAALASVIKDAGRPFNRSTDAAADVRLPDLRARIPVGQSVPTGGMEGDDFEFTDNTGNGVDGTLYSMVQRSRDASRAIGRTGGTERVSRHTHQVHEMPLSGNSSPGNGSPDDGAANGTRGLITFKSSQIDRFIGTDEGGERNGIRPSTRTDNHFERNFCNIRTNSPTRGEGGNNVDSVFNRVNFGINTIDQGAVNHQTGNPEQMPPFLVLNYIIKL